MVIKVHVAQRVLWTVTVISRYKEIDILHVKHQDNGVDLSGCAKV